MKLGNVTYVESRAGGNGGGGGGFLGLGNLFSGNGGGDSGPIPQDFSQSMSRAMARAT